MPVLTGYPWRALLLTLFNQQHPVAIFLLSINRVKFHNILWDISFGWKWISLGLVETNAHFTKTWSAYAWNMTKYVESNEWMCKVYDDRVNIRDCWNNFINRSGVKGKHNIYNRQSLEICGLNGFLLLYILPYSDLESYSLSKINFHFCVHFYFVSHTSIVAES